MEVIVVKQHIVFSLTVSHNETKLFLRVLLVLIELIAFFTNKSTPCLSLYWQAFLGERNNEGGIYHCHFPYQTDSILHFFRSSMLGHICSNSTHVLGGNIKTNQASFHCSVSIFGI
jgi:hypothetical protein